MHAFMSDNSYQYHCVVLVTIIISRRIVYIDSIGVYRTGPYPRSVSSGPFGSWAVSSGHRPYVRGSFWPAIVTYIYMFVYIYISRRSCRRPPPVESVLTAGPDRW